MQHLPQTKSGSEWKLLYIKINSVIQSKYESNSNSTNNQRYKGMTEYKTTRTRRAVNPKINPHPPKGKSTKKAIYTLSSFQPNPLPPNLFHISIPPLI
jgi:hypothetical protein